MRAEETIKSKLIAPCGMNCAICVGHQREKNKCPGCRGMNKSIPTYCRKCIIKHCPELKKLKLQYCSGKCAKYPCKRLKDLDKRYKGKYGMSMIENLESIKTVGIRAFVKNERDRWKCKNCGNMLCVHKDFCLICGKSKE